MGYQREVLFTLQSVKYRSKLGVDMPVYSKKVNYLLIKVHVLSNSTEQERMCKPLNNTF